MAERNQKNKHLSCRICLDRYKDPRRLPCDHIFCTDCLSKHVTQTFNIRHFRSNITCPLCRTESEGHSQDPSSLPNEWVCLSSNSLTVSEEGTKRQSDESSLPNKWACLSSNSLTVSEEGTKRQSDETNKSRCVKYFLPTHDIDAVLEKEESCYINGMVSFDGAMVYVLDRQNEKIKHFDMTGKLIAVLQLSGTPHDITCLQAHHELGITQPDEKLITILSENRLTQRRFIKTLIAYNGICQVNYYTIALSSWSTLSVDTMSIYGQLLCRIVDDAHDLKCDLPNILCKLSNNRIVLTELGSRIMCIQPSYEPPRNYIVQWTYTAPARICGVCTDEDDLTYACVRDRNEVRLIYDDGSLCKALTEKDGINQPVSICYRNGKLFVADEKTIKVFMVVT